MMKACPVKSEPRPLPGVPMNDPPEHQCSGKPGHKHPHYCGCGYEWGDDGKFIT